MQRLEKERTELTYRPSTLFYGSSSFGLWQTLQEDFYVYKLVNLSFGGSILAVSVLYFDRTVALYSPNLLILYTRDNDSGDGRKPKEVLIFFQQFVARTKQRFGDQLPCYFLSFKPSPNHLNLLENFTYANRLIKTYILQQHHNWKFIYIFEQMLNNFGEPKNTYFDVDGLHMNAKGYELWTK